MMPIKIKALEETRAFYKVELEKEKLTERERDKYLSALNLIEGLIENKKKVGEEGKHKKFIDAYLSSKNLVRGKDL